MGTRNLTMVINKEGITKIGQYGQWDGYPGGQGRTALEFLRNTDLNEFQNKLNRCHFCNDLEIQSIEIELETNNELFITKYNHLSRDCGANILYKVNESDGLGLVNQSKFGFNSSCEWAYVIDFSKNTFEIYKGYNQHKLNESQRFYSETDDGGYYGAKMIDWYDLDQLPTEEQFLYNLEDNKGFKERQAFLSRLSKLERITNGVL